MASLGSMTGKIARLPAGKPFGFIKGTNGMEYFFHSSKCDQRSPFSSLKVGDEVTFEDEEGPKGWRAVDVCLA